MKYFIYLFIILGFSSAKASENASLAYIETYKGIAIDEMHRTGIPASIKLAQALLESGAGQSTLAREARNHFGIKCNGGWEGDTYHHKDDDYKNGKLIKSCFRKFNHASESFYEHSEFLKTQKRYAFLFHYSSKDYYAWAHGLKKAGYATDKAYPQKLINIIDKYQLYQYDDMTGDELLLASNEAPEPVTLEETPVTKTTTNRTTSQNRRTASSTRRSTTKKGGLKGLFKKKTQRSSSRPSADEALVYHLVEEGETLADIARQHSLDENKVRLRNRLPKNAEPLPGEKVYLRKKISTINRPEFTRTASNRAIASQDEYIF